MWLYPPSVIVSIYLELSLNGCLGVNWFERLLMGTEGRPGQLACFMFSIKTQELSKPICVDLSYIVHQVALNPRPQWGEHPVQVPLGLSHFTNADSRLTINS